MRCDALGAATGRRIRGRSGRREGGGGLGRAEGRDLLRRRSGRVRGRGMTACATMRYCGDVVVSAVQTKCPSVSSGLCAKVVRKFCDENTVTSGGGGGDGGE